MLYFAGVDMSTTRQALCERTFAACIAQRGETLELFALFPLRDDAELMGFLVEGDFALCGIDAPLCLPPCAFCRDLGCDCRFPAWAAELGEPWESFFHYRLCDILVRRAVPPLSPKPALSNGGPVDITPLSLRWLRLSRALAAHPRQPLARVVEVYASGTAHLLGKKLALSFSKGPTHRTSSLERTRCLSQFSSVFPFRCSGALEVLMVEHQDAFDAVLAAISAVFAAQGRVLHPRMLLGLTQAPAYVKPLHHLSLATREEMADYLASPLWPMLPTF